MKTYRFVSIALLAFMASACQSHYLVDTHVDQAGRISRTVYSTDSTLFFRPAAGWHPLQRTEPFAVDFYDHFDTMRYAAVCNPQAAIPAIVGSTPSQRPVERFESRFLWFFTRYDYTLSFEAWDDLPVPLADYLTDEQVAIYTGSFQIPDGWNGYDVYCMLDSINTRVNRWFSACCFQIRYEAVMPYADTMERALLERYHDNMRDMMIDADDPLEWSLLRCAKPFAELGFLEKMTAAHSDAIDSVVAARMEHFMSIGQRILYRIEMPGMQEGSTMVDGTRLLAGGTRVHFRSYRHHWWAWAITALLAGAGAYALARRWRKGF